MTDEQMHLFEIAEYVAARDKVLMSDDLDALMQHFIDYGLPVPTNKYVAEVTLHKSRTGVRNLPLEIRKASKKWLLARGYTSLDDGDLDDAV